MGSEREGTYVDVRHGEMRGGLRRWVERRWWSEMNPGEEPTSAWLAILILKAIATAALANTPTIKICANAFGKNTRLRQLEVRNCQ